MKPFYGYTDTKVLSLRRRREAGMSESRVRRPQGSPRLPGQSGKDYLYEPLTCNVCGLTVIRLAMAGHYLLYGRTHRGDTK